MSVRDLIAAAVTERAESEAKAREQRKGEQEKSTLAAFKRFFGEGIEPDSVDGAVATVEGIKMRFVKNLGHYTTWSGWLCTRCHRCGADAEVQVYAPADLGEKLAEGWDGYYENHYCSTLHADNESPADRLRNALIEFLGNEQVA